MAYQRHQIMLHGILLAIILIGLVGLNFPLGVRAEPAAPMAGSLTVNSYADSNTSDSILTLREALLIARGGTGANGLNRALSSSEKTLAFGCTFNGSNMITGGCGASLTDTIAFNGLPTGGTITLGTSLPPIDDTQPTNIYGSAFAPTIDANVIHANYGLDIVSNGNTIDSLGVSGAWISDFYVEGDNNTLSFVHAWDSNQQGITISGNYNTVTDSRIGVNTVTDTVCNTVIDRGNTNNGVYITSAATHATVQYNYLGCNGGGVYIVSTNNAGNHTIGPGNRVGVNQSLGGDLGNLNYGIYVGAHNNVVMSNTVSHNGHSGISISGDWNYLGGNTIRANSQAGIELGAWASNNSIGKLSLLGSIVSNTITSNLGHGILITDTTTPPGFNIIVGNYIGVNVDGTAAGNSGNGLFIYGGHDTYIGGGGTQRNIIDSNTLAGINLAGGTYNSHVSNNLIGISHYGAARPNGADGVALQSGAHDNIIGASTVGNIISYNGGAGVLLLDADTTGNLIDQNSIISNTVAGIALRSGATDNRVRGNNIRLSGSAGVLIDSGANNNRIGDYGNRACGNVIGGNVTDGIYIGGATTRFNAVLGNYIGTNQAGNVADPNLHTGIALDGGTYGNLIGEFDTERNVIAGNAWDGVLMINGAHDNTVWGNDIGTNRDYAPVANQQPDRPTGGGGNYLSLPNGGGISIVGSYTNTIGGYIGATDVANFISHNSHTGVYLSNASHHNTVGSNIVSYNGDYGVLLDGGNTAYNTITRTLIFFNGLDGIGERNSAGFNVWTEVGINDNGGLGVDKSIPNSPGAGDFGNVVNVPNNFGIDSINKQTGVVQGHADASILGTVKIELYRVAPDPSGFGEGAIFVGKTTTDVNGHWTITDSGAASARGCYTALVTESQLVIPFSSSEFSANTCRLFLPLTTR